MERRIELVCTNPYCGKPVEVLSKKNVRTENGVQVTKKVVASKCSCGSDVRPMYT